MTDSVEAPGAGKARNALHHHRQNTVVPQISTGDIKLRAAGQGRHTTGADRLRPYGHGVGALASDDTIIGPVKEPYRLSELTAPTVLPFDGFPRNQYSGRPMP